MSCIDRFIFCYINECFPISFNSSIKSLIKKYVNLFGPEFSSDNSGVGPEDALGHSSTSSVRKTSVRNDSAGSAKSVRKKLKKDDSMHHVKSDTELDGIVLRQTEYCRKHCNSSSEKGCLMNAFQLEPGKFDVTKAYV